MTEISATDAARKFTELLDAVEDSGERFTSVRRGKAVATMGPVSGRRGSEVKAMFRRHGVDPSWRTESAALRELVKADRLSEDVPRPGKQQVE